MQRNRKKDKESQLKIKKMIRLIVMERKYIFGLAYLYKYIHILEIKEKKKCVLFL